MRSVMWFSVGVAVGFVAAHQVARTPGGARAFDQLNGLSADLGDAVREGYRQRDDDLRRGTA